MRAMHRPGSVIRAAAAIVAATAACGGSPAAPASTPPSSPPPTTPSPPAPTPAGFTVSLPVSAADVASSAFGLNPFGIHFGGVGAGGHGLDGHPGWDVEIRLGAPVRAAADGVVQSSFADVFTPDRFTVQIQHETAAGPYRTVYTNITTVDPAVQGGAWRRDRSSGWPAPSRSSSAPCGRRLR